MAKKVGKPSYRILTSLHKRTFDELAPIYANRFEQLATKELFLLGPLSLYLKSTFAGRIRVLDIGCGAGGTCAILHEHGFETFGIDLSPKMLEQARVRSPHTNYTEGDFLSWESPEAEFEGVTAKAILHLFDDEHADKFISKISASLCPQGALYLCVGQAEMAAGRILPKSDYPGELARFRRGWTLNEVIAALRKHGLSPVYWANHNDFERSKSWIDCWAIKS